MKKSIFITTTVFMSCFGLAGLTLASGQYSKEDKSSSVGSGMESSGMQSGMQSQGMQSQGMQSQGMPTMQQQKDAVSLSADQVRELQSLLKEEGYQVGNIDGINGPITTGAIRQFQTDRSLEVTGVPNEKTLRSLAPGSEQQEFFGLAPEFGEKQGMKSEKEGMKSEKDGMSSEKDLSPDKKMDGDSMKKGY